MEPQTLQEAIRYFAEPKNCREYLVVRRWRDGKVTCPRCSSENVKWSEKYWRWQCASHHEKRQFTLKTGTIFEDSPIGLDKWLTALWMLVNCKNGVSSWEIHRMVGVTQKTAWFMLHRLRSILSPDDDGTQLGGTGGEVESDETFVGGKPQFMHKDRKARIQQIRSTIPNKDATVRPNKTAVMGLLDRETRTVRARVVPSVRREVIQEKILKEVATGSRVYTDESNAYWGMPVDKFVHEVVNHTREYVRGRVHTNGLENFWSLLKRSLKGSYVSVEPFHLDKYVDEQVFRFNYRGNKDHKITDGDRFSMAATLVAGHRLTYAALTGKVGTAEAV